MKPFNSICFLIYIALPSLSLLLFIPTISSCSSKDKKGFSEIQWAQQVEETKTQDLYAPHYKDREFFVPWIEIADKNFLDVLGWKLFSKTDYTNQEKEFLPLVIPDTAKRLQQTKGDFILWIGHNTFLIRIGDVYWLTDPIFSKRALLPARRTSPALNLREFNNIVNDVNIVISHNHYDHLDRPSMKQLPQHSTVFVPKGLKESVLDMNKNNVHEMDWWEEFEIGNDSKLICLPAQRWSLRISQGRNRSLWASYLLVTPSMTLYFGGDSGYFKGFREIGKKYPGIDYAFMATTAYHPRWFMHSQHMNIKEAVKGFEDLGARYFIPTQWGTFHLGSEPAGFPGIDLSRHIQKNLLDPSRFKIMDIGEILPIGSPIK
ncbi:MAG: MBL fold metallo-hydrolase [Desulfobacula sp.]|uniref:MBL fold metallo-hydrolase n=1 Tax=Desulfobacula sp. TaxID=2593537 RepID=UPI0025BC7BB0|nr:MBL fold metallo-hydrolase [Desulfobacula sp.]MCD4721184.1 MBL fold metallo-hydrolase [Desulfobacula sp.]